MPYAPTNEQQAILAHPVGSHARVLAGPGTGKSAALVALMDQLLGTENPPRIKLLTFTRAATAELAKKVSDHPAAATQRPSTIHSFSISVLLQNPGTGNFPAPLRIADDWENGVIVHPTLAHREDGWGHFIVENAGNGIVPTPTADFTELLHALDELSESDQGFDRYLSQITPMGKDRALAESPGVRIMTMGGAKGLTVRATIIVGLEEGLVPRPDCDLGEQRRFLYVGMTRAKEFLFCTWARRRTGPTARMGAPRVQIRRKCCSFLDGGPVPSSDGSLYIATRWP
jgi:superfamily I DNA/RNA helicase